MLRHTTRRVSHRSYHHSTIGQIPRSLRELQQRMNDGVLTSRQLTEMCLEQTRRWQPHLNHFITITEEHALRQADESDARRARGELRNSVLDGVPFSIKDSFCTEGIRTTCGSRMLESFVAPYDATVYSRLQNGSGAVLIGKTNMDEFAMGSGTTFSHFGATVFNPKQRYDEEDTDGTLSERFVAGGSSGGSAVAVKSHSCMFSIGTDTGGSVRQPASYCGLVGLKPTYGTCSRFGMVSFASSLDTAGIFANNVRDSAAVLDAIVGTDARDSSSRHHADSGGFVDTVDEVLAKEDLRGMKIGVPIEYGVKELGDEILNVWTRAIQLLRSAGADVRYVSLSNTQHALLAYYVIAPAEASSNLARYDGVRYGSRAKDAKSLVDLFTDTRTEGFGDEVKRRILSGSFVLSVDKYDTYFKRSQQIRRLVADDFDKVFEQDRYDLLLTPTSPTAAIPLDKYQSLDPVDRYTNDIFTLPASLAGLPAISIPTQQKSDNSLPLGLQLIAQEFNERKLLSVSAVLEQLLASGE